MSRTASPARPRPLVLLAVLAVGALVGTLLTSAASADSSRGDAARAQQYATKVATSAASKARPAAGRQRALNVRAKLPAAWRKATIVGRVAERSVSVKVRGTNRCVHWNGGKAVLWTRLCGARRGVAARMAHRVDHHKTARAGRQALLNIRAAMPATWRQAIKVSAVRKGKVTLTVKPFKRCLTWNTKGVAKITKGACAIPRPAATTADTLFGFYPGNTTNDPNGMTGTMSSRIDKISAHLGRPGVVRTFFPGLPPAKFAGSNADHGVPVVLSFKAKPTDITRGAHDARLLSFFQSIPTNRQVWWSFYHEPEDNIEKGEFTPAQYRAAWNHLTKLLPKRSTLKPTLILMNWSLYTTGRPVSQYLTDGVKVLAWDIYLSSARPTVAAAYDRAINKSKSLGLGWGVAETSVTDTMTNVSRTQVVKDLVAKSRNHGADFVTWFETNKHDGDWRLSPYRSAAALWKELTH